MNRSMMAGIAFVAGIALAAPLAAYGQGQAQTAPAAPSAAPAPQQSRPAPGGPGVMGRRGIGMPGGMAGSEEMMGWGREPMGQGMGKMGRFGWRRAMMRLSPAERCRDRLARRAAMIAYTVTRLDLTAQQRPLWDKLNAILEAGTQKEQQLCHSLQAGAQGAEVTILDRINWREQFLGTQLHMIQQARPELQQLYQALSPEQKAIVNHPFRHG